MSARPVLLPAGFTVLRAPTTLSKVAEFMRSDKHHVLCPEIPRRLARSLAIGALITSTASACGQDASSSADPLGSTSSGGVDPSSGGGDRTDATSPATTHEGDSEASTGGDGTTGVDTDSGGTDLLPERVQAIVNALNTSLYGCPERAWPGSQEVYRAAQVMLVSEADNIAYLWNDQSLRLVEDHPGTLDLGAVAYWQERLLSEFPDEMAQAARFDVYEGTTQFVRSRMDALAMLSCDASDEEVRAGLVAHMGDWVSSSGYNANGEYYSLGSLAGWLMDDQGRSPAWNATVASGATPVDVLIDGVDPVVQEDDDALLAAVQEAVDQRNSAAAEEIDPLIERLSSADYDRIAVPGEWFTGPYMTSGFYRLREPQQLAGLQVIMNLGATFQTEDGVTVNVSDHTVIADLPGPCTTVDAQASGYFVVTVATADVFEADGLYSSDSAEVNFTDLPMDRIADDDGLPWLCPPAA